MTANQRRILAMLATGSSTIERRNRPYAEHIGLYIAGGGAERERLKRGTFVSLQRYLAMHTIEAFASWQEIYTINDTGRAALDAPLRPTRKEGR